MASDESETCAVCLDATELVVMPCCGRAGTTNFCQRCIETICEMADGGYGSCPKCRKTIAVHGGAVVVAEARGQCRMCNQGNKVIIESGLCDACLYGSRYVLAYECERCHCTQRILHPMWRYCAAPDAYSSATWACHQSCSDYTHWRVVPSDLARVPAQDRPTSWGTEEWFADVRARRQMDRSDGASRPHGSGGGGGGGSGQGTGLEINCVLS
jgi:hypothetical protein